MDKNALFKEYRAIYSNVILNHKKKDNSEKDNSKKTSMMKMMTFSLQTNPTP